MTLKDIEKKIRQDARKEQIRVEKETAENIKTINQEIKKSVTKEYSGEKSRRKKELSAQPRKIISDARLESRREINARKIALLEKVFSEAQKKIRSLDNAEKTRLLKKLITNEGEVTDPVIYVSQKYLPLVKNVKGIKEGSFDDFGVIIENQEGTLRIDNTLSEIMKRVKIELEPRMAKILFK